MAQKQEYIPARMIWQSGSITVLIVGLLMLIIAGVIGNNNRKERNASNAFLTFKNELFREIADSPGHGNDQDIKIMADYLKEHRDNLDGVIRTEKRLRESLTKNERMMLHITNADKLSDALLLMTNSAMWEKLRDNADDRAMLVNILRGRATPPDIMLLDYPDLPRIYIYLWIFIPQLCAFLMYLIMLYNGDYEVRGYHWYQLPIIGKIGLLLLLPGAGIVLIPMVLWAFGRGLSIWVRQGRERNVAQHKAFKSGVALNTSSDASKKLLAKLQQSRR